MDEVFSTNHIPYNLASAFHWFVVSEVGRARCSNVSIALSTLNYCTPSLAIGCSPVDSDR
eukprot:2105521-Prorocentrum_lima.AAC.1